MTWQSLDSKNLACLEADRLGIQIELDAERTAIERNKSGQFATPPALASDIVDYSLRRVPDGQIDFLEPSCGSGSFFSALIRNINHERHYLASAVGVELDPRFAEAAIGLWGDRGLEVVLDDFIEYSKRSERMTNLLIANPPYVRHHYLDKAMKAQLKSLIDERFPWKVSGLSGLYTYFMLLCHKQLAPGAVSTWLIPTEFMDVNYGEALRRYLSSMVKLERIHQFDPSDVQFGDALVSSAVVVFINEAPSSTHIAEFTYGGSLSQPRETRLIPIRDLDPIKKWTRPSLSSKASKIDEPRLGDFFKIHRGLATGANGVFILPRSAAIQLGIESEHLRPILPSPRKLTELVIDADEDGWPLIDTPLALIDSTMADHELELVAPGLWAYLNSFDLEKIRSGYLVQRRVPWYRQEQRHASPFVCTYMGRGGDKLHPFRFILNKSQATATNMFLMLYPRPALLSRINADPTLLEKIHQCLLSVEPAELSAAGRIYGGGLQKIEPKELAALSAERIAVVANLEVSRHRQESLWDS